MLIYINKSVSSVFSDFFMQYNDKKGKFRLPNEIQYHDGVRDL